MQKVVTAAIANIDWNSTNDYTSFFQNYLNSGWIIQSISSSISEDREGYSFMLTALLRKD